MRFGGGGGVFEVVECSVLIVSLGTFYVGRASNRVTSFANEYLSCENKLVSTNVHQSSRSKEERGETKKLDRAHEIKKGAKEHGNLQRSC